METEDLQEEAEKNFTDAKIGYEFNGKPLFAFSGSRQVAAQAMGMRAPAFKPEDVEAITNGKVYSGGLADAIICTWICTVPNASEQTPEDVKAKRKTVQWARNNPVAAYEEAERWAEECGLIDQNAELFWDAYITMIAIIRRVAVSEFKVDVEGASSTEEPGKV